MKKDIQFEIDIVKALSSTKTGDRVVCGYASTFDPDTDNMQITRTALEEAKDDLLKYSTVLFNHDTDRPIGKVVETSVDDIGLFIKVVLSKAEDDIWDKVKEGVISKFSIKGRVTGPMTEQGSDPSQLTQVNDIELFEVSLVSVPANAEAETICYYIAKSLKTQESSNKNMLIQKLNKLLKEKGDDVLRKGVSEIVKEIEEQNEVFEGLVVKLQEIAGKSTAEDRETIENAITLLNKKKDSSEEDGDDVQEDKNFDFSDEAEDRPVFQLSSEDVMTLEEGSTNKFRKQILKLGKWFHWEADGGVLDITMDTIDNIIKNYKKKTIENVYVPLTHTNDPLKNAGEIVKLEKTDEGLDAVIEIKDETVAEKIKKGLIKCISASLDPNYRIKKSNKFAGPTLLHAALVSEPYIKGMGSFIPLADEFSSRPIIQLEDEKPNLNSLYNSIRETMKSIEEKAITEDKVNEIFAELMKKKEIKIEKEEGDACTTEDGKKGKYVDEDGVMVCKAFTNKELDEIAKSAYTDCIGKEMKAGKSMVEAAKICKIKVKKDLDLDVPEEKPEDKSGDSSGEDLGGQSAPEEVDLADVEKAYEGYLKAGKIIPAQKEAFIKLYRSGKVLELGDDKVGVTKLIEQFMEGQPKMIDFEENGAQGDDKGEKDKKIKEDEGAIPEEVKAFFGKMGLSEDGIEESWKYTRELKEKEKEDESTIF